MECPACKTARTQRFTIPVERAGAQDGEQAGSEAGPMFSDSQPFKVLVQHYLATWGSARVLMAS